MQILVTTSRDPSSKLAQFAKEVALVIPGAKSQNRGATVLAQLVESGRASGVTDIVVVHETRCGSRLWHVNSNKGCTQPTWVFNYT